MKVSLRQVNYDEFHALSGRPDVYVEIGELPRGVVDPGSVITSMFAEVLTSFFLGSEFVNERGIVARGKVTWCKNQNQGLTFSVPYWSPGVCPAGVVEFTWRKGELGPSGSSNVAYDLFSECNVWAGTRGDGA